MVDSRGIHFWIAKFQQLGSIYAYGGVPTGTSVTIAIVYIS